MFRSAPQAEPSSYSMLHLRVWLSQSAQWSLPSALLPPFYDGHITEWARRGVTIHPAAGWGDVVLWPSSYNRNVLHRSAQDRLHQSVSNQARKSRISQSASKTEIGDAKKNRKESLSGLPGSIPNWESQGKSCHSQKFVSDLHSSKHMCTCICRKVYESVYTWPHTHTSEKYVRKIIRLACWSTMYTLW